MKSGLEGRNNPYKKDALGITEYRLNEVRPRRPEQSEARHNKHVQNLQVSMKSGLEGRNNLHHG